MTMCFGLVTWSRSRGSGRSWGITYAMSWATAEAPCAPRVAWRSAMVLGGVLSGVRMQVHGTGLICQQKHQQAQARSTWHSFECAARATVEPRPELITSLPGVRENHFDPAASFVVVLHVQAGRFQAGNTHSWRPGWHDVVVWSDNACWELPA